MARSKPRSVPQGIADHACEIVEVSARAGIAVSGQIEGPLGPTGCVV